MTSRLSCSALALALLATALGVEATQAADSPVPAANPTPIETPVVTPSDSPFAPPPGSQDAPAPEAQPGLAPLVAPDGGLETTNYSEQGMSIDFPEAWEIEVIDNGVMIANVTTVETDLVATQVVRMAAPPGPVVDANIDSFIDEGSAVGRYQSVTIDEQDALVIWLSERPDTLTNAIATFIGYGDETILLFSRYAPTNETAEDTILRLHSSFINLAAVAESDEAVTESSAMDSSSDLPETTGLPGSPAATE